MVLAYEKATRAEYTKRIDKVFSNWKGYTHEAEYLERLANPSLEKWNFIQLDTVAHTESDVCQHAILDKYRFQFLRKELKAQVGWFKKYNMFSNFEAGKSDSINKVH